MMKTKNYLALNKDKQYKDGEPCGHNGCLSHISHPCEGCGRRGGINVEQRLMDSILGGIEATHDLIICIINPERVKEVRLLPEWSCVLLGKIIFATLDECDRIGEKELYNDAVLAVYEAWGVNCPHPYPDKYLIPKPVDPDMASMQKYNVAMSNMNYECSICGAKI